MADASAHPFPFPIHPSHHAEVAPMLVPMHPPVCDAATDTEWGFNPSYDRSPCVADVLTFRGSKMGIPPKFETSKVRGWSVHLLISRTAPNRYDPIRCGHYWSSVSRCCDPVAAGGRGTGPYNNGLTVSPRGGPFEGPFGQSSPMKSNTHAASICKTQWSSLKRVVVVVVVVFLAGKRQLFILQIYLKLNTFVWRRCNAAQLHTKGDKFPLFAEHIRVCASVCVVFSFFVFNQRLLLWSPHLAISPLPSAPPDKVLRLSPSLPTYLHTIYMHSNLPAPKVWQVSGFACCFLRNI